MDAIKEVDLGEGKVIYEDDDWYKLHLEAVKNHYIEWSIISVLSDIQIDSVAKRNRPHFIYI